MLVDGAGTVLTTTVNFSSLGGQGTADITVSNGGVWNHTADGTMADAAGSSVTALVTGAGSEFNVTGGFFGVGQGNYNDNGTPGDPSDDYGVQGAAGAASLTVNAGGLMTANSLSIGGENLGDGTKGVGTIAVNGVGSELQLTAVLSGGFPTGSQVGNEGDGTLLITNGGVVRTTGFETAMDGTSSFQIAAASGSTGTVTVSGMGSRLEVDDQFFTVASGSFFDNGTPGDPSDDFGVAGQAANATLTVEDGGRLTGLGVSVASDKDGVGTVVVTGAGSQMIMEATATPEGFTTSITIGQ